VTRSGRSKWEIELNTWPRKIIAITLTLGICGFMFYQTWWLFIAAWITRDGVPDPEIYERAVAYDPENADYRFTLAQIYNYSTEHLDLERARQHYLAAVRLNPYRASHWLELSKFYEQEGDAEGARSAMTKGLEMDPNYAQTHWSAANLFIRLGDLTAADFELRRTADLDVSYLTQVLDLVWRFYEDPEMIVQTHVPNTKDANLSAMNYFIGQDSDLGARLSWDRLQTFNTVPQERFGYVNYLVNKGQPHDAHEVFAGSDQIVELFNGGFESNPMNGGFDWRYSSWEHAEARRDTTQSKEGFASFLIEFDGEENVGYSHVWQWLPVNRGSNYELSLWMRTEAISTDEGVFVEVDGQRSEAPLGTTYWQEFTIPFTASSDLVTVRVRRTPSEKFDNLLGGKVWLDAFQLVAVQ
jgi:hypothetical protein